MLTHCSLRDPFSPWLYNNFSSLKAYLNQGVTMSVKKGTTLLSPGEDAKYIYYILNGKVKSSVVNPNGGEKILFILDQNSMILESISLEESSSPLLVSTLTDAKLVRFDYYQFRNWLVNNPLLRLEYDIFLDNKYKLLLSIHQNFIFYSPNHRLCRLLCTLSAHLGLRFHNKVTINVSLTQIYLAQLLGVSRVTVANILKEMRQRKCIEIKNKRYTLYKSLCEYCTSTTDMN